MVKGHIADQMCSRLRSCMKNGFKIAVTPFVKNLDFEVESLLSCWPAEEKTPFWYARIKNRETAEASLQEILETTSKNGVHILAQDF